MNFVKNKMDFVEIDNIKYELPIVNLDYCKSIRKTTNTINDITIFQIVFVGCDAIWTYENENDLDYHYNRIIDVLSD